MRPASRLLYVPLALALGCAPAAPRREAFAVPGAPAGAAPASSGRFKDVPLGVILSEETLRSQEKGGLNGGAVFRSVEYSRESLFDAYLALLRAEFRSAVRVNSPAEARAAGLPLVAVLDLSYEFPQGIFTTAKCSAAIAFSRPDGVRIEVVRGEGAKHPRDTSGFLALPRMKRAVDDAAEQCRSGVRKALADSPALAAFARAGAVPDGALAEAPPAEPAAVSDVDAPAYRFEPSDKNFALVVGIDRYESLPRAEFAERDASAVREHLRALGYPDRNVVYLTGSKAGKAGIEKYVESWLPRNLDAESRLLVYFSGHGAPDVRTGQAFLMPWDGDAQFVEATGYPLSRLYASLGGLKARRIVVAMDACFSGAGGRSVLARGVRPLVTTVDTAAGKAGPLSVLAASAADEVTGAAVGEGHGLFTYQLLKALNERRGQATVRELFDLVSPRVRDAARRDNRDQTPQLLGEPDGQRQGLR